MTKTRIYSLPVLALVLTLGANDSVEAACPAQVATCCANRATCSPAIFAFLPSPSDYLFRQSWTAMGAAARTQCRAAWQALRGASPCRALLSAPRSNIGNSALTKEGKADWKSAKKGYVFNGVLDCVNKKIHIVPQPARPKKKPDQINWSDADLAKVKSLPVNELKACYGASNCNHGHVVSAYIQKYGTAAQKAAEKAVQGAHTADQFCTFENVRANFLGFTVWTDKTNGTAQFFWNSKQLNGPNLDEPQLPNVNDGTISDKGAYTGTDQKQHSIGILDADSDVVMAIRSNFSNKR